MRDDNMDQKSGKDQKDQKGFQPQSGRNPEQHADQKKPWDKNPSGSRPASKDEKSKDFHHGSDQGRNPQDAKSGQSDSLNQNRNKPSQR